MKFFKVPKRWRTSRRSQNELVVPGKYPSLSSPEPVRQSPALSRVKASKRYADIVRSPIFACSLGSGSYSSLGLVTTFLPTPCNCSSAQASASPNLVTSLKSIRRRSKKQSAKSIIAEKEQEGIPTPRPFLSVERQSTTETRVGQLVKCFELVLTGDEVTGAIDMQYLLRACKECASVLKSIGQRLPAWEMESNIKKLEASYQRTPARRRKTVSELLEFETATGVHQPGHLKDPSSAVALLWIRRSLSCQYRMNGMLLEKRDPVEAAVEAYKAELLPYNGWMEQKIGLVLAKAVPSRVETLAGLGGFEKRAFGEIEEIVTTTDLKQLLSTWSPILARWKQFLKI